MDTTHTHPQDFDIYEVGLLFLKKIGNLMKHISVNPIIEWGLYPHPAVFFNKIIDLKILHIFKLK